MREFNSVIQLNQLKIGTAGYFSLFSGKKREFNSFNSGQRDRIGTGSGHDADTVFIDYFLFLSRCSDLISTLKKILTIFIRPENPI